MLLQLDTRMTTTSSQGMKKRTANSIRPLVNTQLQLTTYNSVVCMVYVCNLQYSYSKCMNIIMHAQFCSDPVVESVIIVFAKSLVPCVTQVACRCSLIVVEGGHHKQQALYCSTYTHIEHACNMRYKYPKRDAISNKQYQ